MEAKEFSEKALLFFAKSKYADLFGVALVITIAIASGYLGTNLAKYVDWGPITNFIPLGVISVINVGISMMSTRLTGRLSNIGNVLGIINTALSGAIDYILGNKAESSPTRSRSSCTPSRFVGGRTPNAARQWNRRPALRAS